MFSIFLNFGVGVVLTFETPPVTALRGQRMPPQCPGPRGPPAIVRNERTMITSRCETQVDRPAPNHGVASLFRQCPVRASYPSFDLCIQICTAVQVPDTRRHAVLIIMHNLYIYNTRTVYYYVCEYVYSMDPP